MSKLRAHAKRSSDGKVKVVVYEPDTGRITATKDIDATPGPNSLKLVQEYLKDNFQIEAGPSTLTLETEQRMLAATPGEEATTADVHIFNQFDRLAEGDDPPPDTPGLHLDHDLAETANRLKTGTDGRPVIEGAVVVPAVPDMELSLSKADKIGPLIGPEPFSLAAPTVPVADWEYQRLVKDGLIIPGKVVPKRPKDPDRLPPFRRPSGESIAIGEDAVIDDVGFSGLTPGQISEKMREYGTTLTNGNLVAGTDFGLPEGMDPFVESGLERIDASDAVSIMHADSEGPPPDEIEEPEPAPPPRPKRARAVRKEPSPTGVEHPRHQGVGGDPIVEGVPTLVQCKTEKVISNNYNCNIVLGRDRVTHRASGYGGRGNTQCGAIDIVVGRMGNQARSKDADGNKQFCDPIFTTAPGSPLMVDAARIYVSQKTDVDKNFALAPGKVGTAEARSAIALKADGVRVMAREGIKLVTRADKINSQGGSVTRIRGVDIIAGNDQKRLQPMVLGNNLTRALNEVAEIVSEVVGTLSNVVANVAQLDQALATHFHPSPFFGAPTLPSPDLAPMCISSLIQLVSRDTFSAASTKWNLNRFRTNYLQPGAKYSIRSRYNNVN